MLRAAKLVVKPNSSITERMRSWVSFATSDLPFNARDRGGGNASSPGNILNGNRSFFLIHQGASSGNDAGIDAGIVTAIIARHIRKVNYF